MKYNPNLHHRRSVRLKGYDYSKAGLYFITICCYKRECLFGEILKSGMEQLMSLSKSGHVVQNGWLEIPVHYPEVVLHEFVVMPNHIHGIIEIVDPVEAKDFSTNNMENDIYVGAKNLSPRNQNSDESTRANIDSPLQHRNAEFRSPTRTIGSIVRGFKIGVTKWHRSNTDIYNVWQRSYHDHIIQNEKAYLKISNYIVKNPNSWKNDMFYES